MVGNSEAGCLVNATAMSEKETTAKEDAGCTAKDFMQGTPFEDLSEPKQQDLLEKIKEGSIRHSTDNFLIVEP